MERYRSKWLHAGRHRSRTPLSRTTRGILSASVCVLGIVITGCGADAISSACPASLHAAVGVRVASAQTGAMIAKGASAGGSIVGGEYSISIGGNDTDTLYVFGGPGTYEVTVAKPGYLSQTLTGIVVTSHDAECHVPTVEYRAVALQPAA